MHNTPPEVLFRAAAEMDLVDERPQANVPKPIRHPDDGDDNDEPTDAEIVASGREMLAPPAGVAIS